MTASRAGSNHMIWQLLHDQFKETPDIGAKPGPKSSGWRTRLAICTLVSRRIPTPQCIWLVAGRAVYLGTRIQNGGAARHLRPPKRPVTGRRRSAAADIGPER